MTPVAKIGITAVAGIAIFAAVALISIQAAGAGHGSYLPMGLFFPFSMIIGIVFHGQEWIMPVVGPLQFLVYCVVFGRGWIKGEEKKIGMRLGVLHSTAALVFLVMFFFD